MTMNYGDVYNPSGLRTMPQQPAQQQMMAQPMMMQQPYGYPAGYLAQDTYQSSAYSQPIIIQQNWGAPRWLKAIGPLIGMTLGVMVGGALSHGMLGNSDMNALGKGAVGALIVTPLALAGSWLGLKTQQAIEEPKQPQMYPPPQQVRSY